MTRDQWFALEEGQVVTTGQPFHISFTIAKRVVVEEIVRFVVDYGGANCETVRPDAKGTLRTFTGDLFHTGINLDKLEIDPWGVALPPRTDPVTFS